MEWISINDRLPKPKTLVLTYGRRRYGEGYTYDVYYYDPGMYQPHFDLITHWAALPEPPKEG